MIWGKRLESWISRTKRAEADKQNWERWDARKAQEVEIQKAALKAKNGAQNARIAAKRSARQRAAAVREQLHLCMMAARHERGEAELRNCKLCAGKAAYSLLRQEGCRV